MNITAANFYKSQHQYWGHHLLVWNLRLEDFDLNLIQQELLRNNIWQGNSPQGDLRLNYKFGSSAIFDAMIQEFIGLKSNVIDIMYDGDTRSFKQIFYKDKEYYKDRTRFVATIYKDLPGFNMSPHKDNSHIIGQLLINLIDNSTSTDFYSTQGLPPILQGPCKQYEGLLFLNNLNSIHGIDGIVKDRYVLYASLILD